MASSPADELVGSLVDGRYTILDAMASGSMGAVYKAERIPVGKLVAIKFLHASYANDSEFLARFERETRVMSKLAHPNCVSVVDFGVWDDAPYLVMEYVAGRTLRSIVDEGPLPPPRALALARQIAAGLAHAHAQGITHRDVKPANIMITEEIGTGEHVRILDFGLARLRGAAGRDATQSNVVVGTPNYMAPEQTIGGGTIDARTDVYAVGIVLFEMIAGERPFKAEDTMSLLGMHRAAPIPALADRVLGAVELPEGLQELIEQAMAKSPDDRFQSAIELAEAIDRVAGTRPSHDTGATRVVPPRTSRKMDTAAVAPTMVDLGSESMSATTSDIRVKRSSSRAGVMFLALLVLSGGAYAAWYLKHRDSTAGPPAGGSGVIAAAADAGSAVAADPDAATEAAGPLDGDTVALGAVVDAGEELAVDAGELTVEADAAVAVDDAGARVEGEIDMAPDPAQATNPAPETRDDVDDEAADAPKTTEDVEKRAPAQPVLATTIGDVLKLIQDGKRDLALASLRALYKKSPKSAYIPFLLGNLYYDQRWWLVALDHYRTAIKNDGGYKKNATLNRNVIRMLVSKKTSAQAELFLKKTIGKASLPYLQAASRNEPHPYVRKYATALARIVRSQ